MDQAEKLRSIVKKQNQITISNARVIAITSGKGGVGKSNVSINMALQYRKLGKSVIIIDADFGLANIEVMFGVIPEYSLSDLIFNEKELKDIITEGPNGVGFISGGSGIAKLLDLDNDQIKKFVGKLSELEELADVIIIDTGAGISGSVIEFLLASPEIILVTTPEPTSVTDAYALVKTLSLRQEYNKKRNKIKVLVNRTSSDKEGAKLYEKLSLVIARFLDVSIEYLGAIPQDQNVVNAVMKQQPVSLIFPKSPATKGFQRMVNQLENNGNMQNDVTRTGIRGYLRTVFHT